MTTVAEGDAAAVAAGVPEPHAPTAATSNRLTAVSNPARSFSHDAAGNTTRDTGNTGTGAGYSASYNLEGRLATLSKAGVTHTYSYNARGERVRKFSSSGAASAVLFAYDQAGQLLGEYDRHGQAIREYAWLGSTPIAGPLCRRPTPKTSGPSLSAYWPGKRSGWIRTGRKRRRFQSFIAAH